MAEIFLMLKCFFFFTQDSNIKTGSVVFFRFGIKPFLHDYILSLGLTEANLYSEVVFVSSDLNSEILLICNSASQQYKVSLVRTSLVFEKA